MPPDPHDAYVAAFDSRCAAAEGPGTRRVDASGIRGLVGVDATTATTLLVHDDTALDTLTAVLPLATAGTVRVLEPAARCAALLHRHPAWVPEPVTAMVRTDLRDLAEPALPAGLAMHPVRRTPEDPPDGVLLPDAVGAAAQAVAADGVVADGAWTERLTTYLASLPRGARILAAVDVGPDAYVFFVNTVPGWQRRGVGLAMTAAALRSAVTAGAARACLDASGAGVPLYRRLGFTAASPLTQFSRAR